MPIKNKNQLFGSGFGQLAEHVDATGRIVKDDVVEDLELMLPSHDLVDQEQLEKHLRYNRFEGGRDVRSFLQFGFEPKKIAEQAKQVAKERFRFQRGVNDESDAFRHALGSYLMTKRYGAVEAKKILDGHERAPGFRSKSLSKDGAVLQDLYNNKIGMEAAVDPKNRDKDPVDVIQELYEKRKLQTRPFRLKRK